MRARRVLVAGMSVLALVLVIMVAAGAWLLYTSAGLAWSLARAQAAAPGFAVENAAGSWARGVSAARLRYVSPDLEITAERVVLVLSPWSVLLGHPRIATLAAEELVVVMREGEDRRAGPPESLALPMDVDVAAAQVGRLVVERAGERHELGDVFLRYSGGARRHELAELRATHELGRAQLRGVLAARGPFALDADVRLDLQRPEPLAIEARLGGTLLDMQVHATAQHPAARVTADALLNPYAASPLARVKADLADLDLHRYDASLPRTRIAGEIAVTAREGRWVGPVRLTNALHGPWDRQRLPLAALAARVALQPDAAELSDLRIELGAAGRLSGSGELAPGSAVLHLAVGALDLRALHTRLQQTALHGRLDLALAGTRQSASGQLAQQDLRLAFEADRMGDDIRVQRVIAQSRGSELRGEGRITLAGTRPYSASATLARFDPAAWGQFPSGSVNGRFSVAGALERDEIALQYALEPSRLLGTTLSGAGRLKYARQRISAAHLQLALGGNRIAADGAFGAAGDRLDLRIDAQQLAVLDARLSGAVGGTAQLGGTWQSPQVSADLTGRRLAFEDVIRVGTLALRGDYRAADDAVFRIDAAGRDVAAAGWTAERIDLQAQGTERAHALTARAHAPDIDFSLRARGGLEERRRWVGTVETLQNAGAVPFALEGPVALEAGAGHLRAGRFSARLMDGELQVAGLRYESGVLETEGRFTRLPVRPLAALAGVPTTPHDTLRVSGHWSITRETRLAVAFSVQRDSGDLAIGAPSALVLGLEDLRAEGRLADGRLQMQATVKSAIVNGSAEASIATREAGGLERILKESPLRGSARLEIARLATLSALMGASAHIDGRVRAELTAAGTVGSPLMSGTLDGEDLVIALPPQGLDLQGGVLRARLQGNQVEVQRFSIRGGAGTLTAQGRLGFAAGQRASLDWRADRLRILARPDRHLVVTGTGNASLDQGKLALIGSLRADEGLFQFGESSLPTLGPDVVVIGRPPPKEEAATLARASLQLSLDFGNDLHILGQGLDAWIEGRVMLRTAAGGRLVASGTVRTQRGTYSAFGQRLQIDRGQLIFDGPVDNPGLDIVAMRKNQAVEAGVALSGTVHAPLVRVVSDPPVPENEALSWLLLGRGPADASRADLAMLPLAAAALFGQGQPGQGSIASMLGVDTISLRGGGGGGGGGGGSLANQVVAVGKRLSHDLYLIYEQGLGSATNVLKIEYNLTRTILLRAETGQVSAAGLFFRYAFD